MIPFIHSGLGSGTMRTRARGYHQMVAARTRKRSSKKSGRGGVRKAKSRGCTPAKGKKYCKIVNGKRVSYGASGYRIKPGTKAGDSYCARSLGIRKKYGRTPANELARRKWKCRGAKSMK